MSPSKREREYARRRYEEYQRKLAEREALRRKRRRQSLQAGAVGLAVVLVAVVVGIFVVGGDDDGDPAASPTAASDTCPEPTTTPPAEPEQWTSVPPAADAEGKAFDVTLNTSCGEIAMRLDGTTAPQATASTVFLARNGFYDATRCHRLTTEGIYVLQCGDPTQTGTGSPGYRYGPVENAPKDNVYPAGTVAMARSGDDAKSMGSQFFLVYQDSTIPSDTAGGYTVVGQITSGLEVVQKVADAGATGATGDGAPQTPVSIESVTVAEAAPAQ